jgi:hypothetical protein
VLLHLCCVGFCYKVSKELVCVNNLLAI